MDAAIMGLLLDEHLLAVSEVESEIGGSAQVADSLSRLQTLGLVHSIGGSFVKPSRAARYFNGLEP